MAFSSLLCSLTSRKNPRILKELRSDLSFYITLRNIRYDITNKTRRNNKTILISSMSLETQLRITETTINRIIFFPVSTSWLISSMPDCKLTIIFHLLLRARELIALV